MAQAAAMLSLMAGRKTIRTTSSLIRNNRPDVVVIDCMAAAPLRGALSTGVPVVILFHTLGAYWARSFDRGPMGRALRLTGIRPGELWARATERLLLTDRTLDPGRDDPALHDFFWTGTTEVGTPPRPTERRPRILVALSSTDWPGMLPVYRRIVTALSRLPVEATVTTGGARLGGQLAGAANVEIRDWVSHAELLPHMDLVIGHGGHSTTMKVLAHGVPLLVMPINATSDQRLIGTTVKTAGLGDWLPKSASPDTIGETVTSILSNDAVRDAAFENGQRLRGLRPGAEVAADRIARSPHVRLP